MNSEYNNLLKKIRPQLGRYSLTPHPLSLLLGAEAPGVPGGSGQIIIYT